MTHPPWQTGQTGLARAVRDVAGTAPSPETRALSIDLLGCSDAVYLYNLLQLGYAKDMLLLASHRIRKDMKGP